MVDVNEIKELKKLGVVKRKSEGPGKYEYSFKVKCGNCGGDVEWCFCTETLEDAKKVIASDRHQCYPCSKKPENMHEDLRRNIQTFMDEHEDIKSWDAACDIYFGELAEYYDGEPHNFDGTTFWECECPIEIEHD